MTILIHLPAKARGEGICFAWKQAATVPKRYRSATSSTASPSSESTSDSGLPDMDGYGYSSSERDIIRLPLAGEVGTDGHNNTSQNSTTTTTTDFYPPTDTTTSLPDYFFGEVDLSDQPYSDSSNFGYKKTKTNAKGKKIRYRFGKSGEGGDDQLEEPVGTYQGCWAIDQVIIVNTAHTPSLLQDSFEPVNPSNFLSFPGAYFKVKHRIVWSLQNKAFKTFFHKTIYLYENTSADLIFSTDLQIVSSLKSMQSNHV